MIGFRRRAPSFDVADVQANIIDALAFRHAHSLVVRIDRPDAARRLIGDLLPIIASAGLRHEKKPEITANVALSAGGLRRLGVDEETIVSFGDAFAQGMAARAAVLGDTGPSDPSTWPPGFASGEAHLLVWLHAKDEPMLSAATEAWRVRATNHGLALVHELRSQMYGQGREHFGFADGFSQPQIRGLAKRMPGQTRRQFRREPLPPGEFVLGYPDYFGAVAAAASHPIGRNASMLVWRQLHQDVYRFRSWIREVAGPDGDHEFVAAKLVGRWRDGAPLVLAPNDLHRQHESNDVLVRNHFSYADDPLGVRCPLGAHVRRTNPRDGLPFSALAERHRLIRRGVPYGEPLERYAPDDGSERGLLFVSFQSDIERQFEFVQQQWCNDGSRLYIGADRDPLIGAARPGDRFVIQGCPPWIASDLPAFVTTRAGEYFVAPGLRALGEIAGVRHESLSRHARPNWLDR